MPLSAMLRSSFVRSPALLCVSAPPLPKVIGANPSERKAQLELDHPRPRVIGRVDIVVRISRLPEQVADRYISEPVRRQEEVRVIQNVQRLGAELDIPALPDP